MRLAMAISPSRDRSSTEPISRRYMRTGSSVRSAGSELRVATAVVRAVSTTSPPSASSSSAAFGGFLLRLLGVLGVDDIDAHLVEHRVHVLDLIGGDLLGRQHRVQFLMGDPAALLGDLDHPLDGGVGQIEQRAVRRLPRRRPRLQPSARLSSPYGLSVGPAPKRGFATMRPFTDRSPPAQRPRRDQSSPSFKGPRARILHKCAGNSRPHQSAIAPNPPLTVSQRRKRHTAARSGPTASRTPRWPPRRSPDRRDSP